MRELANGSQAAACHTVGGRTLGEAVTGYLRNVAGVKRKDIGEAVTEFLQADAPRTRAADGQRAQLSAKYAYNRELQLRRFAATFQNTAVSELSKEHLDKFIGSLTWRRAGLNDSLVFPVGGFNNHIQP